MERLVDIDELSQILSIPKGSIYNLVSLRQIPFYKVGHRLRFDPTEIAKWIQQYREEPELHSGKHGHQNLHGYRRSPTRMGA